MDKGCMPLDACVEYFKSNKGFNRLFVKIKGKYRSLGRIGGTVLLTNLSADEKEALCGLFKKDYSHQKSASIRIENLQKCLDQTKFKGLSVEDVMNSYFGYEIVPKKLERSSFEESRNLFFTELIERWEGTKAGDWLKYSWYGMKNAYKAFVQRYDSDAEALRQDIGAVCRAVNGLPCMSGDKVRLPVFASLIAKNPHAFDIDKGCGQLFLYALSYVFGCERPNSAEKRAELYYSAGILPDEVSSYVILSGIRAYTERGIHKGWEGFIASHEPLLISLYNLGGLKRAASYGKKVFVVENPAVFTAIMDNMEAAGISRYSLICTYGQVKIAALVLLDMLAYDGSVIYYSGDFDPEGLSIADKLKSRYGEKCVLWRYTREDYNEALSAKAISPDGMGKLLSIKDPQLKDIAAAIRNTGLAGYQELLIDKLAYDIRINTESAKYFTIS